MATSKPRLTEEQAHRLVQVLLRKSRGTIDQVWTHVHAHYDVTTDREEAA